VLKLGLYSMHCNEFHPVYAMRRGSGGGGVDVLFVSVPDCAAYKRPGRLGAAVAA
jgi:hypothetical protein